MALAFSLAASRTLAVFCAARSAAARTLSRAIPAVSFRVSGMSGAPLYDVFASGALLRFGAGDDVAFFRALLFFLALMPAKILTIVLAVDRKSVVEGKSVSVRVNLGG